MTSSAPFRRFAFAFGTTFAVLYVLALAKDLALFTVFPSLGIVALIAAAFAGRLARYVWPGLVWVIPVLSMIACVYLTLPWFRL